MDKSLAAKRLKALAVALVLVALSFATSFLYRTPVMRYINIALDICSVVIIFITAYSSLVSIFGLLRPKKYPETDCRARFAVVTSARNEAAVIGRLIESIRAQDYPKELIDIFVIADNCTDSTAETAASMGAKVYCRHDTEKIGKGFALHWFFEIFNREYPDGYDAISIFDADNLLDPGFFSAMNRVLASGADAAMGYRDSKNPFDNWIAGNTSVGFLNMVRFYYNARSQVGLSALFGGTGYFFRRELVRDGWNTFTVTEDTEFSMQVIAKGVRIAFCYDARFYDEQPTSLRISIRQRFRWCVGKQDCVRYCTRSLLSGMRGKNIILCFDGWMRVIFPLATAIRFVIAILERLSGIFAGLMGAEAAVSTTAELLSPAVIAGGLLSIGAGSILLAFALIIIERKPLKKMILTLLMAPVYSVISTVLNVIALFFRDRSWRRIPHTRAITVDELEK